jgi:electron transport complex protein RnfB
VPDTLAPFATTADGDADRAALAGRLDAVLPQTQCRRCGYDGCRPYADAIAAGVAHNRCPPGGETTLRALATLTGRPIVPLDPALEAAGPLVVARIDEAWCIGCTLCIAACPVDAIVGAPKRMHVVLSAPCTGCGLCLPPCPVDCIAMVPAGRAWSPEDARASRQRHATRARRLERLAAESNDTTLADDPSTAAPAANPGQAQRRQAVDAALARARARRAAQAAK